MSIQSRVTALAQRIATEFNGLRTERGDLSTLTTTVKTSIVNAINEVNNKVGTLIDDASNSLTKTWSSSKLTAMFNALTNGNRKNKAIDLADGAFAAPTSASGDRYVLIDDGHGPVHSSWNGASYNDIVTHDGTNYQAVTPVEG